LAMLVSVACSAKSRRASSPPAPAPAAAQAPARAAPAEPKPAQTVDLLTARRGFATQLVGNPHPGAGPAPVPPAEIFQLVKYRSPVGPLVAYLTPPPADQRRHPAVIWAHGGFGGI